MLSICLSLSLSRCVCVCVCVCLFMCEMQDVSKTKNLLSLERVAGGHQKASESEI